MGTNVSNKANASILKKLAGISEKLDKIEKKGHNEQQHYDYVRATDVVDAVRQEFQDNDLLFLPCVDKCEVHETGDGQLVTTIEIRVEIRDITGEESIFLHWAGQGADFGDKGLYKAITGGIKYFLLNLFLIPTGDDPENDSEEVAEVEQRNPAPRIPKDRARNIKKIAESVGLVDGRGVKTTLKAKLQSLGCSSGKILDLNVDQAESVEAFLREEKQ